MITENSCSAHTAHTDSYLAVCRYAVSTADTSPHPTSCDCPPRTGHCVVGWILATRLLQRHGVLTPTMLLVTPIHYFDTSTTRQDVHASVAQRGLRERLSDSGDASALGEELDSRRRGSSPRIFHKAMPLNRGRTQDSRSFRMALTRQGCTCTV